jgi:hypothetical protein
MKIIATILAILAGGYGVWLVSHNHPDVKTKVASMLDMGNFHTLEVRYNANQIMDKHRRNLLKDSRHRFLDPVLEFYPYLMMEVKYTSPDDKTHESVILWDLIDGEMVISTKDWEKTHGFGDCILADTTPQEFKILNILAKKGGAVDRDGLSRALQVEHEVLNTWLDTLRKKKLIIQAGNHYKLHFQHPKLRTIPETKLDERLVTKPYKDAVRLGRHFSPGQIERTARAAFGQNFAIRKMDDVYLPVHSITVQNPDGSVHTSHWNALNGKRLSRSHLID